ncbi:hypothetical protein ACIBCH_09630 [Amycolatopsis thailandensis]|uniref:hypothetical protein n=1 Tax=Amycolatopsis thailandensis TaxID=589330 RepID=UPI003793B44F
MNQLIAFVALVAARTALVGSIATTWCLAPSVGFLALHEGNWVARGIMVGLFAGVWVSVFALAAARARFAPRRVA